MNQSQLGWPKSITVVRHGESEGNVMTEKDYRKMTKPGHRYSLTKKGQMQARRLGRHLRANYEFDAVFVSQLTRARETLDLLKLGKKAIEDARLNEWDRGVWHNMHRDEMFEKFPHEKTLDALLGRYMHRPLGGENGPDVESRIQSLILALRLEWSDRHVLLVGHGEWIAFFIKVMRSEYLQTFLKNRLGKIPNCSVWRFENVGKKSKKPVLTIEGAVY